MTGELSKNFHGVGIGPLSKILAVKRNYIRAYCPNIYIYCELGTRLVK